MIVSTNEMSWLKVVLCTAKPTESLLAMSRKWASLFSGIAILQLAVDYHFAAYHLLAQYVPWPRVEKWLLVANLNSVLDPMTKKKTMKDQLKINQMRKFDFEWMSLFFRDRLRDCYNKFSLMRLLQKKESRVIQSHRDNLNEVLWFVVLPSDDFNWVVHSDNNDAAHEFQKQFNRSHIVRLPKQSDKIFHIILVECTIWIYIKNDEDWCI